MAKPIRKYGKGAVSLAVFENANDDGSRNEFYSLQRSRKIGDEWKNESILLSKEQLAIVQEIVGQALSGGEEGASSSPSCSSPTAETTHDVPQGSPSTPVTIAESAQTKLTETDEEFRAQVESIQDEREEDRIRKEAVQVIEVYDWGIVERKNYKGEVERLHDFLVHSDNAIVAIGIGDIEEAIKEVRQELTDNGYRNIVVKRMPMKEGERVDALVDCGRRS